MKLHWCILNYFVIISLLIILLLFVVLSMIWWLLSVVLVDLIVQYLFIVIIILIRGLGRKPQIGKSGRASRCSPLSAAQVADLAWLLASSSYWQKKNAACW